MKVKEIIEESNGRWRFNLSVGGFVVKNVRWYPRSRRILFPIRYDRHRRPYRVVNVHGAHVKRLRNLLESAETELPRDRRPCVLKIHALRESRNNRWLIFSFTVRGFTILGCRWHPQSGSIQLPVTFAFDEGRTTFAYVKKPVVCAYGAHINRLRRALEAHSGLRRLEVETIA